MKKISLLLLAAILLNGISIVSFAQNVKNDLSLTLGYFNSNNQTHYLMVHAKSKIDGKFQMIPNVAVTFYISTESPANVLGKAVTNEKGEALVLIPPSAKNEWNKSAKQSFIAVSQTSKLFDEAKGTLDITKAKIKMDTLADRKIVATLVELKDSVWTPVKGVDIKVTVKRLDGDLNVSETATYATDSLGVATAEFKRDSLPGDAKGALTLIAKVEDNDLYGNLSAEKLVPWGAAFKYNSEFDKRTLFARRGRSPIWLEFMAYSIVLVVWGILFYLFGQIRKLKRLGV